MIHVLFSSSAGGTLRQVLRERGQETRVIDFMGSLEWGSIKDGDLKAREGWFETHVPSRPRVWTWLAENAERFRIEVASDADRLIWLAPRSAGEQAGLYWYLQQFGGGDAQFLIADYIFRTDAHRHAAPLGLGELNYDAMSQLLDEAPRAMWDQTGFAEGKWMNLVSENANLRIVQDGNLSSVRDSYFDNILLSSCPKNWTRFYNVIGDAMYNISKSGHTVGEDFLFWRMAELHKAGKIECEEEFPRYGAKFSNAPRARSLR